MGQQPGPAFAQLEMEAGIGRPRGAALDARGGSRQAPSTMRCFGRPKNGVPMQGNAGDAGDESDPGGFFFGHCSTFSAILNCILPFLGTFGHCCQFCHLATFGHFRLPLATFGHFGIATNEKHAASIERMQLVTGMCKFSVTQLQRNATQTEQPIKHPNHIIFILPVAQA